MNLYKLRLPHSTEVLSGCSTRLVRDIRSTSSPGFIYCAFGENPVLYLIPSVPSSECRISDEEAAIWIRENDSLVHVETSDVKSAEDYKSEYMTLAKRFISLTRQWDSEGNGAPPGRSKIILSRIARHKCNRTPIELFADLCDAYPNACVFLFSTSAHGTWIGASPEPILEAREGRLSSLSLAGTRWDTDPQAPWDLKNIEEQEIVTGFISSSFKEFGFNPELNGPFTVTAGPVSHLATEISAEGKSKDLELLRHLCPTPALSGYPRKEAILQIQRLESPGRGCYGGMIGLIWPDGDFSTFANLRSGHLDSTASVMELRAGGGLTHLSEPEKEWEETEKKLQTLRKFIEKR